MFYEPYLSTMGQTLKSNIISGHIFAKVDFIVANHLRYSEVYHLLYISWKSKTESSFLCLNSYEADCIKIWLPGKEDTGFRQEIKIRVQRKICRYLYILGNIRDNCFNYHFLIIFILSDTGCHKIIHIFVFHSYPYYLLIWNASNLDTCH